jgi:hypothetical protein
MKYTYTTLFILLMIPIAQVAYPAENSASKVTPKSNATVIQFSVIPSFYEWPTGLNVYGLRIGVPVSYGGNTYVYGIDYGLFMSESRNVKGLQLSLSNSGNNGDGVQLGLVNVSEQSNLLQIGLFNQSSENSSCFQIGLINKLDNGFLPVFPLINFSI